MPLASCRVVASLALAVSLLAACADTPPEVLFTRPDTTPQQTQRDLAECDYQAKLATAGNADTIIVQSKDNAEGWSEAASAGILGGYHQAELRIQCMKLRGYTSHSGL